MPGRATWLTPVAGEPELTCETDKGDIKKTKPKPGDERTAGNLCIVYPCGVILSIREIQRSESTSQVWHMMLSLFELINWVPQLLGYDDACHLYLFVHNSARYACHTHLNSDFRTVWARIKESTHFFIDRFHFSNHVDAWCQQNMSPFRDEVKQRLEGCNTEICEQTFKWLAKYKYSSIGMGRLRFNWFVLRMCELHNHHTIDRQQKKGKNPRLACDADRGGAEYVLS